MSILTLPDKRLVQPTYTVELAKEYRDRLVFANHRYSKLFISQQTAIKANTRKNGVADSFNGSDYKKAFNKLPNTPLTLIVGAVQASASSFKYLMGTAYDGGANEALTFRMNGDQLQISCYTGSENLVGLTAPASGGYYTYFAEVGKGNATENTSIGYIDTLGVITKTSSSMFRSNSASYDYYVGSAANISTPWRFYDAPILWSAVFRGNLTDREKKALALNPWQLFEQYDTFYFNLPSSGGITYNVNVNLSAIIDNTSFTRLDAQNSISLSKGLELMGTNNTVNLGEIVLGNTLINSTNSTIYANNSLTFGLSKSLSIVSALQATGNIEVNLSLSNSLGITSTSQVQANDSCTISTNIEITPTGNLHITNSCSISVVSSTSINGGFNIAESIALQSTTGITGNIKLEIAGTVSLTSALGQAIAQNSLINGQVFLTTAIAENIVTTLLAQDSIGIGFEILSTFTGTNPAVLARIGTQEILFTIATSKLHFINSGKDTLFTSS